MRDLISEKSAGSPKVAADSNLVKLQKKVLDAMEPLSKVWTTVENASNSRFQQVEDSLPEILTNLGQTVMLLGQAFNNILYTRCVNGNQGNQVIHGHQANNNTKINIGHSFKDTEVIQK